MHKTGLCALQPKQEHPLHYICNDCDCRSMALPALLTGMAVLLACVGALYAAGAVRRLPYALSLMVGAAMGAAKQVSRSSLFTHSKRTCICSCMHSFTQSLSHSRTHLITPYSVHLCMHSLMHSIARTYTVMHASILQYMMCQGNHVLTSTCLLATQPCLFALLVD